MIKSLLTALLICGIGAGLPPLGSAGAVDPLTGSLISYGVCESQFDDKGLCLHIPDCEYLYKMLQSKNISAQNKQLLQNSQCGYDNTQTTFDRRVLICCPDKYCRDPDSTASRSIPPGNVLPKAGECGVYLGDRVYGGTDTNIDEFPWMVQILYRTPNNTTGSHCAGSLISSRYVLTAAHCIANDKINSSWISSVRLGEWNTATNPDCDDDVTGRKRCAPPYVDIDIDSKIVHPGYVETSLDQFDDIALLRLARGVAYTEYVKPICLPVAPEIRNNRFEGTAMDISGWGATEHNTSSRLKQKAMVSAWKWQDCGNTYKSFQRRIDGMKQLCAGGQSHIDTCGGDSGGPLMVNEMLGNVLVSFIVGVVSYGPTPCALIGWPGVYTHVGSYIDWIQMNMVA